MLKKVGFTYLNILISIKSHWNDKFVSSGYNNGTRQTTLLACQRQVKHVRLVTICDFPEYWILRAKVSRPFVRSFFRDNPMTLCKRKIDLPGTRQTLRFSRLKVPIYSPSRQALRLSRVCTRTSVSTEFVCARLFEHHNYSCQIIYSLNLCGTYPRW